MGYVGSAVNVVSSSPCVGPLLRIRIFFPLLSICTDHLISAPKIMTFFPKLPSLNKNSERESNAMRSRYTYLIGEKKTELILVG